MKNLWTLFLLILLTLGSFFFSASSGETGGGELLLLFTLIKVGLVAFFFMELKKAHIAWWLILGAVLAVFACVAVLIHP